MRHALRFVAPALVIAACAPSGAASTDTAAAAPKVDLAAEEKAIRDRDAEWLRAVEAKDTAAIQRFYATDALFMPPNGQALGGPAGVQKGWGAVFAIPEGRMRFAPTLVTVASAGDMAYDVGTYTFTFKGPRGTVEDKGKYLVVWKKQGGEWKVAADMFNTDMP